MLHYAALVTQYVAKTLVGVLLPASSSFSAMSLLSALAVACGFLFLRRPPNKRHIPYRVMMRALFPSWLYRHSSFRADIFFVVFNVFVFSAMFGWAIVSADFVAEAVHRGLTGTFGGFGAPGVSVFTGKVVAAIALFLAYEIAYWLDHYLSHRIPFLWEFHRVHHTAEVLSPITNFRVHPVDSIVFSNILGLFIGATHGLLLYLRFVSADTAATGVIALAGVWLFGHLQHSHLWISFSGRIGHVLLSPAHHQIHHSENPKHFNKNFGSLLSVWDWLFGTLHVPARESEQLTFGVGHRNPREHTVVGGMLIPFFRAARHGRRLLPTRAPHRQTLAGPNG